MSSGRPGSVPSLGLLQPVHAIVAGLAAAGFLLIMVEGVIPRLALLSIMLVLVAPVSAPALKRIFLAVAILEIPIGVDIYINHDVVEAKTNALSGFNLSITTLVLVALYSLWAAELASGFDQLSPIAVRAAVPSFVYVGFVTFSLAVATESLLAMYEIVVLVQALLLFFYLLQHIRNCQDLLFILAVLMIGLIAQSLIVFGLQVLGQDVSFGPVSARIDAGRAEGTFGSPNILGSYFTLMLPIALGLMLSSAGQRYRRLSATAFGMGSLALVLSFSRGAWIGFAVAVGFVAFIAIRRRWIEGTILVFVGAVATLMLILFQGEILQRLSGYNDQAALSRLPLMQLAVSMIRDAPLIGVGANNFAASLDPYLTVEYSKDWITTVHNKYLLVWAETGLFGLLSFLWVLVAAVSKGWRIFSQGDRLVAPLAVGLTAGVMGNMVHMLVEIFKGRSQVQLLWLVLALILALPESGRFDQALNEPVRRLRRTHA